MCRLRFESANLARVACALLLAALAGCSTGANMLPAEQAAANGVQLLSDSDADEIVAQAIAQHEMRRP
jgi:hypothetical protein